MVRENDYGPFTSMGKNLINHKWGSAVDDATKLLSGVSSNTGLTEKFVKGVLDKFLKEISENEESTPKEKKSRRTGLSNGEEGEIGRFLRRGFSKIRK